VSLWPTIVDTLRSVTRAFSAGFAGLALNPSSSFLRCFFWFRGFVVLPLTHSI